MMQYIIDKLQPPIVGRLVYWADEYSFAFQPAAAEAVHEALGNAGRTSVLIGSLQIEVGVATNRAAFVWGYHPRQAWAKQLLSPPQAQAGGLKIVTHTPLEEGVSVPLVEPNEWRTFYDSSNGWVCVGDYHLRQNCIFIEFATHTIAAIEDEMLRAIWLRPDIEP
jgi:hypothetical protein